MGKRYRMEPTPEQVVVMTRHCADARFVWNLGVQQYVFALSHRPYRVGKRQNWPTRSERQHQLTEVRGEYPWLAEGSSSVQQEALRDLHRAYNNHFENPGHFGWPSYRLKHVAEGFCIRDVTVHKLSRKWAEVLVPKCGYVKFRLSRPVGEHGMARVTLDRSGRWHVSFNTPQTAIGRESTGSVVGLDRGIVITVATSDGEQFNCPRPTKEERQRKARLQRKMSRQKNGSNRREKTRKAIAKLYAQEKDRRKDWVEKTSTTLVKNHDVIVLEDLKVVNMSKSAKGTKKKPGKKVAQKRGLNRSIREQGWGMLATRIKDKAAASGVVVVEIPAPGTSQRCAKCGHRCKENRTSQASFCCQQCGHEANADINAAKNIRAAGLAVLARGGVEVDAVEPRTTSKAAT